MMIEISFRQIENQRGIVVHESELDSSLGYWYETVRDRKICEFDDEDLCIACRQNLYPDYIVPAAIERLKTDPLAGGKYDGELIVALTSVSDTYWEANSHQGKDLKHILILAHDNVDHELRSDVVNLLKRLDQIDS